MERTERLQELLRAQPGDPFLQHALALEYVKVGQDSTARSVFESLLAENPGYIGSYYHLAKLLERLDATDEAIRVYEKGMEAAQRAGDQHTYSELRSAFEELNF